MNTGIEVTKYTTDNDNLLFIGSNDDEEYYQKIDETGGWSFMGLRPSTESELRERARERDIEDFLDSKIPPYLEKYIDYDKFADDMEEQWEEDYDVQARRENEDGETLYLGFGSGTDAKHYFKEHGINSYEDYCNHFECIGLTKSEFNKFKKEYAK
jgi:hypothetical protein